MSRRRRSNNKTNQGSTILGKYRVEFRTMPVGELKIEPEYQRRINMGWVKQIEDNFNPLLVETIQVSFRDGHYWVFDGQHTITAIKRKFKDDKYPVTCKIYRGLTKTDEAKLFYDFNTQKKRMSAPSMLKAKKAFQDEETLEFLKHTEDAGFIVDLEKSITCRYGISAVVTAFNCYQQLGPENYDKMLRLLHDTWDGEQWSTSQNMLNAMTLLIRVYGDRIDETRFVSKLNMVTRGQLARKRNEYDNSVPVSFASAILSFYNFKLAKKSRLERIELLDEVEG